MDMKLKEILLLSIKKQINKKKKKKARHTKYLWICKPCPKQNQLNEIVCT